MKAITVLGAGGKMGLRISENLQRSDYEVRHVEIRERGKSVLAQRGLTAVSTEEAMNGTEAVILALPDNRIAAVTAQMDPMLKSGVMLIALDIAAPMAGALPKRSDLTSFVTHPCHTPVFLGGLQPRPHTNFFCRTNPPQRLLTPLLTARAEP